MYPSRYKEVIVFLIFCFLKEELCFRAYWYLISCMTERSVCQIESLFIFLIYLSMYQAYLTLVIWQLNLTVEFNLYNSFHIQTVFSCNSLQISQLNTDPSPCWCKLLTTGYSNIAFVRPLRDACACMYTMWPFL
jgi:hypothetical protein